MKKESGFTLVELLTVIAIIGIVSGMAVQSFKTYKAKSAYAVAEQTLVDARIALEAALSEPDAIFPFDLANYSQSTPGEFANPNASSLFPGFRIPRNATVTVNHDPDCVSGACLSKSVEVRHCGGLEYVSWSRFGDGVEIKLEHIDGAGC